MMMNNAVGMIVKEVNGIDDSFTVYYIHYIPVIPVKTRFIRRLSPRYER